MTGPNIHISNQFWSFDGNMSESSEKNEKEKPFKVWRNLEVSQFQLENILDERETTNQTQKSPTWP